MGTEIKTWQVVDGTLEPVASTLTEEGRKEVHDLEEWIASNPSVVGADITLIGRQVPTRSGPLDLLAIDRHGNTVVIELKRDKLPRDTLAQAIDYASDVAGWSVEKLSEICIQYTDRSLEDQFAEAFPDVSLENININETQRILLVGFGIEEPLERMINWLSGAYGVNINAIVLQYVRTSHGDELLSRVAIISEELEYQRTRQRKFQIPMSDDPGDYPEDALKRKISQYLVQDLVSARRIRRILLPVLLRDNRATREQLKEEFVQRGEAKTLREAGYSLASVSQQIGMAKNDFLRQVIGYEYDPDAPWMKESYFLRDGYSELVREVLDALENEE